MKTIESTLAIFAHPDDVAWTCAGTIVGMTETGEEVDQIMVTSGGYGGDSNKKETRLREERQSMDILGMRELIPLDFPDGELSEEMFGDLVRSILHVIDSAAQKGVVYRRVMSFGPDDGYSGHPDHKIVARAVEYVYRMRDQVKELAQVVMSPEEREFWPNSWKLGNQNILVPQPEITVCRQTNISGTLFKKVNAIHTHASQRDGKNGGLAQIKRVRKVYRRSPFEYWRVNTRS